MNGKGLIITVVGVGVGLGGLIISAERTLGSAIVSTRAAIAAMQEDVSDLRERMARLKGLFEGRLNGDCTE